LFLKEAVSQEGRAVLRYLAKLFDAGKAQGEFKLEIDSRALANLFFCAVEGSMVISRGTESRYTMNAVVGQCKKILEQITLEDATT
jgi:hypothetical protein